MVVLCIEVDTKSCYDIVHEDSLDEDGVVVFIRGK